MKYFLPAVFLFLMQFAFSQEPTYFSHIRPIIQKHCIACHSHGNVGPIPMRTYEEVASFGKMIEYVTRHRIMPPYKADADFSAVKGCASLSASEIEAIRIWTENGFPRGMENITAGDQADESREPVDTLFYDLTFEMEEDFPIENDYKSVWRVFPVPTNLDRDVYVNKIKFVPGNRRLVRSCAVSIDTSRRIFTYDKTDPRYGYENFAGIGYIPHQYIWYFWFPGTEGDHLMAPFVKKIPAGSTLVFHIQYAASGSFSTDRSRLLVSTMKETEQKSEIQSQLVASHEQILSDRDFIRPNVQKICRATISMEKNIRIHALTPLAQYVCRSWKISVKKHKSKLVIPLLSIPDWDVMWKRKYEFIDPVEVEKGDEIMIEIMYVNSIENLNIPQFPTRNIIPGEGKREEMFALQYDYSERKD